MEPRLFKKDAAAAYCSLPAEDFVQLVEAGVMPPPIPGTRLFDRFAIDRAKQQLLQDGEVRHRAKLPMPTTEPRSRYEPPSYAHLRQAPLSSALQAELGVDNAIDLVGKLNELWKAEGKRPLSQGSFPTKPARLLFVVKQLRLALIRLKQSKLKSEAPGH